MKPEVGCVGVQAMKLWVDASFTISFLIAWYMFCDTPYGWQIMAHPEFEGVKIFPLWIFGIA
jgi:hypothetical protein